MENLAFQTISPPKMELVKEFALKAQPVLQRFFTQNRCDVSPSDLRAFATAIWNVASEFGMPRPLQGKDKGEAKEMSLQQLSILVFKVLEAAALPSKSADRGFQYLAASQMLRMLLQPEFLACRLSYQNRDDSGICERQDPVHCSGRISGSACEDCPLYVSMDQKRHSKVLKIGWHDDNVDPDSHMQVLLPEDFRQLRLWLHEQRRR